MTLFNSRLPARNWKTAFLMTAVAVFLLPATAQAGDQIQIVGSSTVYPFATAVAEQFGQDTKHASPLVEATGTGGGFKLFCNGIGEKTPSVANASRPIKDSEREQCKKNGVTDITEIKFGFDGIVIANSKTAKPFSLTKAQVFQALAKKLPDAKGELIDNPHRLWSDIDPALPASNIEVYGPPPTSGTRDAFVEMVMEKSCVDLPAFKKAYPNSDEMKKMCHLLREDGHYIDMGENDNLIVQKLHSNPVALGIFGYSFLEQNAGEVQAASIDGIMPSFEAISSGKYSVSRSLFIYIKDQNATAENGLAQFAQEFVSTSAAGPEGYLIDKGLIPLPEKDLSTVQAVAAKISTPVKK